MHDSRLERSVSEGVRPVASGELSLCYSPPSSFQCPLSDPFRLSVPGSPRGALVPWTECSPLNGVDGVRDSQDENSIPVGETEAVHDCELLSRQPKSPLMQLSIQLSLLTYFQALVEQLHVLSSNSDVRD